MEQVPTYRTTGLPRQEGVKGMRDGGEEEDVGRRGRAYVDCTGTPYLFISSAVKLSCRASLFIVMAFIALSFWTGLSRLWVTATLDPPGFHPSGARLHIPSFQHD